MSAFTHDLIVIGAGPAGMTAALTASSHGLRTLLLDEQPRPGGQIYRNIGAISPSIAAVLGPDYLHGKTLTERLAHANVDTQFGSMVWDVAQDLTVSVQKNGRSFQVRAPQLIAATGAMERPSPIPGWTLPGVMNAGAAQIALKSSGAVPSGRVVLAGAGPLLLLVATKTSIVWLSTVWLAPRACRPNWSPRSMRVSGRQWIPKISRNALPRRDRCPSATAPRNSPHRSLLNTRL